MFAKMKLYEKVVDQLREAISTGKYKVGERIPTEPELMQTYAVGRSTIREAIKTLAIGGVLTIRQGAGTYVNAPSPEMAIEQRLKSAHFEDINAVRSLLEKEIVRLATEKHQPDDVTAMEEAITSRKQAILENDRPKCAEADIAFHMAIAKASKNPVLADLYNSFTLIMRNFFSVRETQGITVFAMNHHLHEELLKAIKSGKVKPSLAAVQAILENNY